MNAVTETVAAEPVSGVEIFVPLAKLKKSPRNARKVPHGEAAIEALAASIQHKGLIQTRITEMKKPDMAQAAEQLLAGTGWLPAALRTLQPEADQAEVEAVEPFAEAEEVPEDTYAVAAE